MPAWYPLVRASRYLGVAPWELAEQSVVWLDWALAAESAENEARASLAEARSKKNANRR